MPELTSNGGKLHLPDLYIKGFGGIKELSISRLGRVTLVAGENAVGKTTLLDAIRVYAARGGYDVVADILQRREEYIEAEDEDSEKVLTPNWDAIFYGRNISENSVLSVGPLDKAQQLRIRLLRIADLHRNALEELEIRSPRFFLDSDPQIFEVSLAKKQEYIPMFDRRRTSMSYRYRRSVKNPLGEILCESLGPGLPANARLARFWDKIALTDNETKIISALNLIFKGKAERATMIGDDRGVRYSYGRRAVVKVSGEDQPVPLKSLGDGATRLFGLALALANSQDGFLLIDEVENGIHHSRQPDFWTTVLQTAQANNVQVLVTTHGWDCVAGFAQAATDVDEVDVALVRLERDGDTVRAVEYSERNLKAAARSGIEVR